LKNDICILIPARIASVRLPNKLLINISNLPVIEHTRRRALLNKYKIPVYVVTGDRKIAQIIEDFGGKVLLNNENHENGTDRCAEVAKKLKYKKIIILQGDEILNNPKNIDRIIASSKRNAKVPVINAICKVTEIKDLVDESIVKCYLNKSNEILSLFRKTPLTVDRNKQLNYVWKVSGLFAYSKSALINLSTLPIGNIQKLESIEQFKLMENQININTTEIIEDGSSLNTPTDLKKIRRILKNDKKQTAILKNILRMK
jgi:3-deoxy-manno-octulosonate cytidylyltransferase (CMP-KDO synthetase)